MIGGMFHNKNFSIIVNNIPGLRLIIYFDRYSWLLQIAKQALELL
jgi:hypothetical protein